VQNVLALTFRNWPEKFLCDKFFLTKIMKSILCALKKTKKQKNNGLHVFFGLEKRIQKLSAISSRIFKEFDRFFDTSKLLNPCTPASYTTAAMHDGRCNHATWPWRASGAWVCSNLQDSPRLRFLGLSGCMLVPSYLQYLCLERLLDIKGFSNLAVTHFVTNVMP